MISDEINAFVNPESCKVGIIQQETGRYLCFLVNSQWKLGEVSY